MHGKIVIAGGGPAGASLAIRLAQEGFSVTLVEREEFPREKLCGEFISPECLSHFQELGVGNDLFSAGGTRIEKTIFFARSGRSITVPSEWLNSSQLALGLSRAAMDDLLMKRAAAAGVETVTGTSITGLRFEKARLVEAITKGVSGTGVIHGDLFVDATGRTGVLSKLAVRELGSPRKRDERRSDFVAFKAHLSGAVDLQDACEIYSFDAGYGGLNAVEDNKSNFCFILRSEEARRFRGRQETLFASLIKQNARSAKTLVGAEPLHDWLAVAIEGFGKNDFRPAENIFSVGDAASFIDPFTGSGILMALESSKILSNAIVKGFGEASLVATIYATEYERVFSNRLRLANLLRKSAYRPKLASTLIYLFSLSEASIRRIAKATRFQSRIATPDA
jgi:flavin-dependent dehydrogenase